LCGCVCVGGWGGGCFDLEGSHPPQTPKTKHQTQRPFPLIFHSRLTPSSFLFAPPRTHAYTHTHTHTLTHTGTLACSPRRWTPAPRGTSPPPPGGPTKRVPKKTRVCPSVRVSNVQLASQRLSGSRRPQGAHTRVVHMWWCGVSRVGKLVAAVVVGRWSLFLGLARVCPSLPPLVHRGGGGGHIRY
jgi:hypothetical protein